MPPTRSRRTLAERIRSAGGVSWALIGIFLLLYGAFRFLVRPISVIFPPVIIAAVLTYVLNPLVTWLGRHGVKRWAAVLVVYIVFLATVTAIVNALVPVIAHQVQSLLDALPAYVDKAARRFNTFAERQGFSARLEAPSNLGELIQANRGAIFRFLGGVRTFAGQVLHIVVTIVIGLVLSVYLLLDLPKIQKAAIKAIPPDHRDEVVDVLERVGAALGGFFRGQLLVAAFVGVASALVLTWPVKLPFAAVIGLLAGVFNLIPLIGPFLAGVPAIAVGLLSGTPSKALWAALGLLVVQQIDNHIISPNVMGRTVRLHPITVMLALLAGGTIAGIPGMLVVIPGVAASKIVAAHLWARREELGVPEGIAEAGT